MRNHQRLSLDESDRVSRISRIFALAAETLGGDERAREWLHRPLRQFGNRRPFDMLATDLGDHQVETLLGRIAHGVAASRSGGSHAGRSPRSMAKARGFTAGVGIGPASR